MRNIETHEKLTKKEHKTCRDSIYNENDKQNVFKIDL